MYTIQYVALSGETRMQELDTKYRHRLVTHLARYRRPVIAVFEQSTPITEAVRKDLKQFAGTLSTHARDFAFSMNLTTRHRIARQS
jgi:hypothetical protein